MMREQELESTLSRQREVSVSASNKHQIVK